jgi:hypothetical protein
MRFTANFPRAVIEQRFPFEVGPQDWLISIISQNDAPVVPAQNFGDIARFRFDDDEGHVLGSMVPKQAWRMAEIVREAARLEKNVWVHCTAGMCRSGAVVEVLGLLGWTIVEEFSPQRIANEHVFNLLRLQFPELRHSWEINDWINWALPKE